MNIEGGNTPKEWAGKGWAGKGWARGGRGVGEGSHKRFTSRIYFKILLFVR